MLFHLKTVATAAGKNGNKEEIVETFFLQTVILRCHFLNPVFYPMKQWSETIYNQAMYNVKVMYWQ